MPAADVDAFLRFVRLAEQPLYVGMRLGAPHPTRLAALPPGGSAAGALLVPRLWPAVLVCWTPMRMSMTPSTMPAAPLVAPVADVNAPAPPGFAQVAFADLEVPVQVPLSSLVLPSHARLVTDERALELLYLCNGDVARALLAVTHESATYERSKPERLRAVPPTASFADCRSLLMQYAEAAVLPPPPAGRGSLAAHAVLRPTAVHASELVVWGVDEQMRFARAFTRFGTRFTDIAAVMSTTREQVRKMAAQCAAFYYRTRRWRKQLITDADQPRAVVDEWWGAASGDVARTPALLHSAAAVGPVLLPKKRPRSQISAASSSSDVLLQEGDLPAVAAELPQGGAAAAGAAPRRRSRWALPRDPPPVMTHSLTCTICGLTKSTAQTALCSSPTCRAVNCEACFRVQVSGVATQRGCCPNVRDLGVHLPAWRRRARWHAWRRRAHGSALHLVVHWPA